MLIAAAAVAAPLVAGERLEWSVSWMGLDAGVAWSMLVDVGEGTWTIEAGATSAPWLGGLYPVDDRLTSVPGRYSAHFREGRFARDEEHRIGPATVVTRTQLLDGAWRTWDDHYAGGAGAFDPLASFYRLRDAVAPPGEEVRFPLWTGRKAVELRARTVGREELDGVPILRVALRSGEDGPDIHDRLTVLLTDDADRVPVRAIVATRAGDVTARLRSRSLR